jgi:predicted dehydrogenase
MESKPLRIGLIGAGTNTRARHIPGLRAIAGVELAAVCNRRAESTAAIAQEFGIARTFERWQDLIASPDLDAVVIGTWPYLHCPITLAALEAGKHVLTEARMSMTALEAQAMLAAAHKHADLVTQIVPSPFGLKGHDVMVELLRGGFIGEAREIQVIHFSGALADPASALSWRQDAALSGFNTLTLGILHETLLRWVPPPVRVLAQAHAFIAARIDPQSGVRREVGTPDSVQVLAVMAKGARASYHFSGVVPLGHQASITLFGSEGVLRYDLLADQILGAKRQGGTPPTLQQLPEIAIPAERARAWQVEADFVRAIREQAPIHFTDFATGVAYMEFTEAVARSASEGVPVDLPLASADDDEGDT